MGNAGSEWGKWDLHIHTPASFHWYGPALRSLDADARRTFWDSAFARMTESGVSVFAIQDYFTFAGYHSYREDADRTIQHPVVLPGIELRVTAPADYRLNFHVIFDNILPKDRLEEFVHGLKIVGTDRSPTPTNLVGFARGLDSGKIKKAGFQPDDRDDEEKMLALGYRTVSVTFESVKQTLAERFHRSEYVVVQPYDTSDGLDRLKWQKHMAADSERFKFTDIFETRNPDNVDLFLGKVTEKNASFIDDFIECLGGGPKPVCSGSDAHRISHYGVFPNDRITWIRARPTFRGLIQCIAEPRLRTYIGTEPEKLTSLKRNPTSYARSVRIYPKHQKHQDQLGWFNSEVELNPGLVAIIGNKGGGKSALADVISRCGNAHRNGYAFLNQNRFRKSPNPSQHFVAELNWYDGHTDSAVLSTDPGPEDPERIHYLPQHYVERLCNEIAHGSSSFEDEIKSVIFQHIEEVDRLGVDSLDALIEAKSFEYDNNTSQEIAALDEINQKISQLRRESSAENVAHLRHQKIEVVREIAALEKQRPNEVSVSTFDDSAGATSTVQVELEAARTDSRQISFEIDEAKKKQTNINILIATCYKIRDGIREIESFSKRKLDDLRDLSKKTGVDLSGVVSVSVNYDVIDDRIRQLSTEKDALASLLDEENSGLIAKKDQIEARIRQLQEELSEDARKMEDEVQALASWEARMAKLRGSDLEPGSEQWIRAKLEYATSGAQKDLQHGSELRFETLTEIHKGIKKKRDLLIHLFQPLQDLVGSKELTELPIAFSAAISPIDFKLKFLSFINQRKRGHFSGVAEGGSAVDTLAMGVDWSSTKSVSVFVQSVVDALAEGGSLTDQLVSGRTAEELENFLFSLRYLDVRYTIRLNDKSIETMSPGERGALLLVFYLLLDPRKQPLVIDQPEENLDNETIYRILVPCFQKARERRQVIIVTHSPNLAIASDADQVIRCKIDKENQNKVTYESFAIEDPEGNINALNVLEGTWPAFRTRAFRYGHHLRERR